jgi:hypothetical protein
MGSIMPRRFGRTQLAIIAYLRRRPDRTIPELAAAIYSVREGTAPTKAQLVATYRATRVLALAKIIEKWSYRSLEGLEIWRLTKRATERAFRAPPKPTPLRVVKAPVSTS